MHLGNDLEGLLKDRQPTRHLDASCSFTPAIQQTELQVHDFVGKPLKECANSQNHCGCYLAILDSEE
jgi:hypothetical protein